MKEILFKAKRCDNGQWITSGTIFQTKDFGKIAAYMPMTGATCVTPTDDASGNIYGINDCMFYRVDPETIGQYTGLEDAKGNKIFEGDIVLNDFEPDPYLFCPDCVVSVDGTMEAIDEYTWQEIVGNLHDKPGVFAEFWEADE